MTDRQRVAAVCVAVVTVGAMIVDALTSIRWLGAVSGPGLLTVSLTALFAPFD